MGAGGGDLQGVFGELLTANIRQQHPGDRFLFTGGSWLVESGFSMEKARDVCQVVRHPDVVAASQGRFGPIFSWHDEGA